MPARCERRRKRSPEGLSAHREVALAGSFFERAQRFFRGSPHEGEVEEASRAVELSVLRGNLRRPPERLDAIGGGLRTRHLSLVEIDHLGGLTREGRESLEERLHVFRRDARKARFTVLDSFFRRYTSLNPNLRLADELSRALRPGHLLHKSSRFTQIRSLSHSSMGRASKNIASLPRKMGCDKMARCDLLT